MKIDKEDIIEIARTDNGYIIQDSFWKDTDESGNKIIGNNTYVIKDDYDENEAIKQLFLKLYELLGYSYDKYGKENLNITFDGKGRKL